VFNLNPFLSLEPVGAYKPHKSDAWAVYVRVRVCACQLHASIVSKQLNVGSGGVIHQVLAGPMPCH